MVKKVKCAVIGATGAVGQVFMWMLARHPWFNLIYPTASAARVGQKYHESVHWVLPFEMPANIADLEIKEFSYEKMKKAGVKVVFSALPANIACEAEALLRDKGFWVFSNAASFRYDNDVPILIPEANWEQLSKIEEQGYPKKGFIVTNANCVTTGLAMAIAPLRKYGIKSIHICSYQSVSGAGYPGLSSFDITDNCIPFINGEEEKIVKEIQKILDIKCEVYPYCVRVPVMFGHLEAIWLEFGKTPEIEDVIQDWKNFSLPYETPSTPKQSIVYSAENTSPQQNFSFWGDPRGMVVYTGRLKKVNNKIGFVCLVNNIVKGAAGGSIQNAETFLKKYNLI